MSRLVRMGLAATLMMGTVPLMAKPNDAGAAPPPDKPGDILAETGEGIAPEQVKAAADVATIVPAVTDSPEYLALQTERDKLADNLVRLGNYLKQAGFTSEDGGPVSDVDIAIHHLGLKDGYMKGIEAAGLALAEAQDQVADLTQKNADLQLALETAQARAKREVEEALTGDGSQPAEKPAMEIRHIQNRRRLVPRGWPAG
ncbi:hypothetical protein [Asticcacaulis taihuensis]|uniref:hypothetical protein n=1 Tax=Asticcacaulis taihuensis TaxID=260084 RepID=UPI0026F35C7A|nr:hypothetical protein [Asticcacaulis taihuensis]